jgi:glycosyltransferase involved in cell wall biosynthesis
VNGYPLSVGIVTRDRREHVLAAVRLVLPQLEDGDELVVVDNGSRDGTADAVAGILDRLGAGCRVVVEPEVGVSAARNRALAEARTSTICFIDDDARPWPDWLTQLRRAWSAATEQTASIGGPISPEFLAPRPAWLADHQLYLVAALDLGVVRRPLDQTPGYGYLWGGNMSLRVAPTLGVGGFDPRLGIRPEAPDDDGEEEELQRRLVAAGYEVWYEPTAGVQHLLPTERLTPALLRRKLRGRTRGHARRGASRLHGLSVLARAAAGCVRALLSGRRDAAIEASFGIVQGWTLVFASRRR